MTWRKTRHANLCCSHELIESVLYPKYGLSIREEFDGNCTLSRFMIIDERAKWIIQEGTDGSLQSCMALAEEIIDSGELELDALDGMGK